MSQQAHRELLRDLDALAEWTGEKPGRHVRLSGSLARPDRAGLARVRAIEHRDGQVYFYEGLGRRPHEAIKQLARAMRTGGPRIGGAI